MFNQAELGPFSFGSPTGANNNGPGGGGVGVGGGVLLGGSDCGNNNLSGKLGGVGTGGGLGGGVGGGYGQQRDSGLSGANGGNGGGGGLGVGMMPNNNGSGDSSQQHQIDRTKLIVNYIPQFATEEELALIFKQVGRVESVKIMRDYNTGYSFGFGFVKYFAPEDAAKAIDAINGMNFRNKRLKVSYSRPPGSDMKDSNLYITNLPKEITEEDIDGLFGEFGEIVQRTVLRDKITGLPRGVAFVRFSKGEEAQAAIAKLDGKLLDNAMFPLSVRVAEDHGRQKAQFLEPMWAPFLPNRGTGDQAGARPVRPAAFKRAPRSAQLRHVKQAVQNQRAQMMRGGGGGSAYDAVNYNFGGGRGGNWTNPPNRKYTYPTNKFSNSMY